MARRSSTADLLLPGPVPDRGTRSKWLYDGLREAILSGRLPRNMQVPATRELAKRYGLARATVSAVFDQLCSEGYLHSHGGRGTFVCSSVPDDFVPQKNGADRRSARIVQSAVPARAFRLNEPALDAFPVETWARIGSRRLHRLSRSLLGRAQPHGYEPLRQAVADYLVSSRGAKCEADQVVIVSGVQHGLDLVARLVLTRSDSVWMEDPGYSGAVNAFRRAGASVVAVPVDQYGMVVVEGERKAPLARAVYVTPAHQFPLGYAMTLERRLQLIAWARRTGGLIIEDDYDSEFRYEGRPIPALQGLDAGSSVVLLGSFNKALFPSLRLGYLVLPERIVDSFLEMRFQVDRYSPQLEQSILCDFLAEGHFMRHLRRMRTLYQSRLSVLREEIAQNLGEAMQIPPIEAGLQTPAFFRSTISADAVLDAMIAQGLESSTLATYSLERTDLSGLILGFAAINDIEIRRGVRALRSAVLQAR